MTFERPCRVKGTGLCDCTSHMGDVVCTQEWSGTWETVAPKVEPPAEARQMAALIFATYAAYVESGFSEEQAMRLVLAHIASSSGECMMPKSKYKRHPDVVAALTQEEGILVCGAAGCPAALNIVQIPAPKTVGWALQHGWWLCPEHRRKDET